MLIAKKAMVPTKASGPNGFPALFFQNYWHIVREEVGTYCVNTENIKTE